MNSATRTRGMGQKRGCPHPVPDGFVVETILGHDIERHDAARSDHPRHLLQVSRGCVEFQVDKDLMGVHKVHGAVGRAG